MAPIALLLVVCSQGTPAAVPGPGLDRHMYPLSKAPATPPVVVDASDFPEGQAWGDAAKKLVEIWFPRVCELLATEDYRVPAEIKLVIKKEINVPAYASGGTITINGKWITQHPDDLGMAVHELVHVVQQYPNSRNKPGWLVEGIADYIRWWRYEPEYHAVRGRPRIDPEKSKYTDSYRTTGYFLAWASKKHHMGLVPALEARRPNAGVREAHRQERRRTMEGVYRGEALRN
jgi:hypothetical protein